MTTMNKKDLIKMIQKDTGWSIKDSQTALASTLANIMKIVSDPQLDLPNFKSPNKLSLIGFGTFEKVLRKARTYINPQTREKIEVGEKGIVKFRPGKYFKELLQLKN